MNVENIRKNFPILDQKIHDKKLVYLDNAATTQKPNAVIERISSYYQTINSNVHRGVHTLSRLATEEMEAARKHVQTFIKAESDQEIIFTKGTTESLNLIAQSFSQTFLHEDDGVLISGMEHHSNFVPWQMACERQKAKLLIIPLLPNGDLDIHAFDQLLEQQVKIVSIAHISNVLGTINPIEYIINSAHNKNIPVVIDGAQSIAHTSVDVKALDCDFFAFSGHKMYGPTGIGVLYGKREWLEKLSPYQFGGEMISEVTPEKTVFNELPFKFEAGTPDVSGILGLDSAISYIEHIGLHKIKSYEDSLLSYATEKLNALGGIELVGTSEHKASVLSFNLTGAHPYDVGSILDHLGIAVRTGHHCAQPLMNDYHIPGTVRASFAFYNTPEEVDRFIEGVSKAKMMLLE